MKQSTRSFAVRICAIIVALWLVCAGVLTWAVAQDFQRQIYRDTEFLAENIWGHSYAVDTSFHLPGRDSLIQLSQLGDPYLWLRPEPLLPIVLEQTPSSFDSNDWFWGKWELLYGFQPATVFYDEAGDTLIKSGNLLGMYYITEEAWQKQKTDIQGAAYIDLDQLPQGVEFPRLDPWNHPMTHSPTRTWPRIIRARGYFIGDRFVPVYVDMAEDFDELQDTQFLEKLCQQDAQGSVQWESVLTLDAQPQSPLVTIYIRETCQYSFEHESIRINGKEYASLVDLAQEKDIPRYSGNLLESVIVLSANADEETGADTFRLAVRIKPLRYAMLRLIPVYFWGSLIVALCLWLLTRSIRRQLTSPLKNIAFCMDLGAPMAPQSAWEDVRQAESHIQQAQSQIRTLQNEKQQLQSSLEYAKHAEESRRQLVSNITHELKTPLAVIHSYAEGLQAGIAEEKREKYLRTILEESEKMDAMVLEMLDLSRLEAGKVRLSNDRFSLLALTKDILDKLAPEETRTHRILFGFCNECMINADEGRISQVVTNLISNALRYTPQAECIWLQVYTRDDNAYFHITNQAKHLDVESLERIFDSFYRVDSARSDRGTGLGLPIARSIIQLHRGTLSVKNTWVNGRPCLEFTFQIPLK